MVNPVRSLRNDKLAAHGGRIGQSAEGGHNYSLLARRQRLTKLSQSSQDSSGSQWQTSNGVKSYLTKTPSETKRIGKIFAEEFLKKSKKQKAVIIGLIGELGGGKTTFLQGLAKGLGIKEKILSPTFVILKKFQIPNPKSQINSLDAKRTGRRVAFQIPKFKAFYHIDCYRVDKPKHILDLGFKEILAEPANIAAIEWADKVRKILPQNVLMVKFEFVDEKTRRITIKAKSVKPQLKTKKF